jgi:hypothetical protein
LQRSTKKQNNVCREIDKVLENTFMNMQKILLLLLIVVTSNVIYAESFLECQQRTDKEWRESLAENVKEIQAQEVQAQQEFKALMAEQRKEVLPSVAIAAKLLPQLCIRSLYERWCNFWEKK